MKAANEPEVTQLLRLLDVELIKEEVESLRPGYKVTKILKNPDSMDNINEWKGQFNLQIKIDFDDGKSWMMRIRRKAGIRPYPDEPLRMNIKSDVAFVKHFIKVVLPCLHPKLMYSYQTFIEGPPWQDFPSSKPRDQLLSPSTKRHIESIAKWFISMEKVKFDKIGSPTFTLESREEVVIGSLIERQPSMTIPPYFSGPFRTAKERYLSTINGRLEALKSRTLVDPSREVPNYLALLELKELVGDDLEMGRDTGSFYIRHADDHWDHTRTKEGGEVTGIIDWEWAYTTNKAEAFASPMHFLPSEFYHEGSNDVFSPREYALIEAYQSLGRDDLADCVKVGRKYQRLIYFLKCMFTNVLELNAIRKAFLKIPDEDIDDFPKTEEEWVEKMSIKWRDEKGLRGLVDNPVEETVLPERI
ncbi:hypothetical protein L486_04164 [Kwoniella mangroviensis CBS 10435]|uniref:Aminoglycoside phosphotransferase domain-containing protein n=1 Tax=Kwoniella mangroviensis CBS 10435 TaxID=1331196 RepID=A0A1B9IRT3_9TREE|nr:uncharacterized protein I203_02747 [Kwoniella mangroviensis CBS 8507]OCF58134.1 hypothetical protein L486_04164 [Kwoniella mangroviensis CBS 10435]OCF68088.1 hypothetical protein I203_02747 [Kwoniella mangroviensis CBS 8507]